MGCRLRRMWGRDRQADSLEAKRIEDLRDENQQKVAILSRMIDSLQWTICEPSELSEWITAWEKMDRIEKQGFAGRVA